LKKVSKNKTFEYRISEEEKSINSIIKGLAEEKDEDILRVGVIGYENVGKRSLINGLKKGLKEGNAEGVELKD
jgi:ribosome biogenesis GTPase A